MPVNPGSVRTPPMQSSAPSPLLARGSKLPQVAVSRLTGVARLLNRFVPSDRLRNPHPALGSIDQSQTSRPSVAPYSRPPWPGGLNAGPMPYSVAGRLRRKRSWSNDTDANRLPKGRPSPRGQGLEEPRASVEVHQLWVGREIAATGESFAFERALPGLKRDRIGPWFWSGAVSRIPSI